MPLSQRRRRLVQRLRRRKARAGEGLVLVEGVRAVGEALAGRADVRFLVTSPGLALTPGGSELLALGKKRGLSAEETDDRELAAVCDTKHPQGILAVCAEPRFGPGVMRKGGRYVVLDGVQDPGNVGTLVRAAVAFGLDGILTLDGTADPWGAKAVRASAGLVFHRPVLYIEGGEALPRLRSEGIDLLVADASGTEAQSGRPAGGWALVLGNEGAGVRSDIMEAASARIAVPMEGPAESLNVGMAGAILLYVLTRERERG
jgi:TrmH family RNA methyltransferase